MSAHSEMVEAPRLSDSDIEHLLVEVSAEKYFGVTNETAIDLLKELQSLRAAGEPKNIRQLEWEQNAQQLKNDLWACADEIDRSYTIAPDSNVFRVETTIFMSGDDDDLGLHPTLGAAKRSAQCHFEARILQAITTPDSTNTDILADVREREARLIEALSLTKQLIEKDPAWNYVIDASDMNHCLGDVISSALSESEGGA